MPHNEPGGISEENLEIFQRNSPACRSAVRFRSDSGEKAPHAANNNKQRVDGSL